MKTCYFLRIVGDGEGDAKFMAMTNHGVITDILTWKCFKIYIAGFTKADFDDSEWDSPTALQGVWTDIASGSDLGWQGALPIASDGNTFYCRTHLPLMPGKI